MSASESLFLITYMQDGLLRRDSYFHFADEAQQHCRYLQDLFPEAQVTLHEIAMQLAPRERLQFLEL